MISSSPAFARMPKAQPNNYPCPASQPMVYVRGWFDDGPSGLSTTCPPGQACCANTTPCADKSGFACGTSLVNASGWCEHLCPSGTDDNCPPWLSCYETEACRTWGRTTRRRRHRWLGGQGTVHTAQNVATACAKPRPSGLSSECPDRGMSCYAHTLCEETSSRRRRRATIVAETCADRCPTGSPTECPPGMSCSPTQRAPPSLPALMPYVPAPSPTTSGESSARVHALPGPQGVLLRPGQRGGHRHLRRALSAGPLLGLPPGLSCFACTTCADRSSNGRR